MQRSANDQKGGGGYGDGKKPEWPTLDKQLAESKVIHGSALHKLILDNQDFHMLNPGEANDDIRVPLWLRIHWRKQHPEGRYSAADPSGGYPLALRDMYKWMITYQDLKAPADNEIRKGGQDGS